MSEIIEKPYVLHVAEVIYLEICQIKKNANINNVEACLLYTSPSPRDKRQSRMPSSA